MKPIQTIGIVLISIILLSVTAVSALENDNTNTNINKPVTDLEFKAAFTAAPDTNKPLTVRFTEESIGKPVPYLWGGKQFTYFWGFGDKTTSKLRNPVHTFKEAGKYNVYLRIQNAEGQVSKTVKVIDVK